MKRFFLTLSLCSTIASAPAFAQTSDAVKQAYNLFGESSNLRSHDQTKSDSISGGLSHTSEVQSIDSPIKSGSGEAVESSSDDPDAQVDQTPDVTSAPAKSNDNKTDDSSVESAVESGSTKNKTRLLADSNLSSTGQNDSPLSATSIDLCKKWNLCDLDEFERLRGLAKSATHTQSDTINYMFAKQTFLENVLSVHFDLQNSLGSVVREIASTQELNATMVYHRDKAIRYNTYANFVAGGITGILSGSFDLAKLPEVNANSLDIIEGAAQTGLSAWALKQLRTEHNVIQGVPNVLASLIVDTPDRPDFPNSIWEFLNSVPEDSKTGKTRREDMVNRWLKHKFCLVHGGHLRSHETRAKHISGTAEKSRLEIDVMEDRVAMLEDLRSTLFTMNEPLGKIIQYIRAN